MILLLAVFRLVYLGKDAGTVSDYITDINPLTFQMSMGVLDKDHAEEAFVAVSAKDAVRVGDIVYTLSKGMLAGVIIQYEAWKTEITV